MSNAAPKVDLFWSVRSPFCYLALHRLRHLPDDMPIDLNLRPVYPLALRQPDQHGPPGSTKAAYNFMDAARVANMLGLAFREPVHDPLNHRAHGNTHAQLLTRMLVAAQAQGRSLALADRIATAIFAETADWTTQSALHDLVLAAKIDATRLFADLAREKTRIEDRIEENTLDLEKSGHWGVPLMVWNGEPFFGQDRVNVLAWRLRQKAPQV